MVRMMVSNLQDMLTSKFSGSIPLNQSNSPEILRTGAQDSYVDFNVLDLQGDIDYLVVDGTLPLEPSRNVEAWMQILGIMQQTGLTMEYDGGAIAEEAIKAMGIPNIERFKLDPSRPMSPSQEISVMEKMRGASVMPQGDIDGQVSAGNLVPAGRGAGMKTIPDPQSLSSFVNPRPETMSSPSLRTTHAKPICASVQSRSASKTSTRHKDEAIAQLRADLNDIKQDQPMTKNELVFRLRKMQEEERFDG